MQDTSCGVFGADPDLDPGRIHRFVVGEDPAPRPMSAAEAEQELGDPFATLVLLAGRFPRTAEDTVEAIKEAVQDGDPLREQMSFLLGEGGKIPFDDATAALERGLRFLVTLGATADGPPEGPDILLSVSHPRTIDIELMAWDRRAGGFNYYRSMGDPPAWVFAGNGRHAFAEGSDGKGVFQAHPSGAFLMKELKLPWVHWDSPEAHIFADAFAPDDDRPLHEWFIQKQAGGAYTLEFAVARPAIDRWSRGRFDALAADGGVIDRPGRIMQQVLATPTANLASSIRESRSASPSPSSVGLPPSFFADVEDLRAVGLEGPPPFDVPDEFYQETLRRFGVSLRDGQGFVKAGDTHFAFVILERALEDQLALRDAMRIGLLSRRLAACLLMVDFPNPIFSDRREALLAHVPATATVENGASGFSQEMADAILGAAQAALDGSPEREFADRWEVGEDFVGPFNDLLTAYYRAVSVRVKTQPGFDDYYRLGESRRQRGIAEMAILGEFPLLFARASISPGPLAMHADGKVV